MGKGETRISDDVSGVGPPSSNEAARGAFDLAADTNAGDFCFDPDHVWEIGPLGPRFAGYHRTTYQEALITLVRPNIPASEEFIRRFKEATERAVRATHQNLIRTLGSGLFGQSLFYATERLAVERL